MIGRPQVLFFRYLINSLTISFTLFFVFLNLVLIILWDSSVFPLDRRSFWLIAVGLSDAFLACLLSWPVALSIVSFLQQVRSTRFYKWVRKVVQFLATLPLVVFGFIFVEVVGELLLQGMETIWARTFQQSSELSQSLAFAITLLIQPLRRFFSDSTVHETFLEVEKTLLNLTEIGILSSTLVFVLILYILPQMILLMMDDLDAQDQQTSAEQVRALGGSAWESVRLSVLQQLKLRFWNWVFKLSRLCFFEGLITWSVLNAFFGLNIEGLQHWGGTLTSFAVLQAVQGEQVSNLQSLGFALLVIFIFFFIAERTLQTLQIQRERP